MIGAQGSGSWRHAVREIMIAASFSALLLLPFWSRLLDVQWQQAGVMAIHQYQAAILLFGIIALVTLIVRLVARRARGRMGIILSTIGAAVQCVVLLVVLRPWLPSNLIVQWGVKAALAIALVGAVASSIVILRLHRKINVAASIALLVLSPFAVLAVAQSAAIASGMVKLGAERNDIGRIPLLYTGAHGGSNRTVIILFDELDYHLLFERRHGAPVSTHFNRLRSESLFATAAYAAGPLTSIAVPAMLTGRDVSNSQSMPRDVVLSFEDGSRGQFSKTPSIWSDARSRGQTTLRMGGIPAGEGEGDARFVVGPRLSGCPALVPCLGSMVTELAARIPLTSTIPVYTLFDPVLGAQARAVEASVDQAAMLAARADVDLLYLHIMVPHEPFVYDRAQGRFMGRNSQNYDDALAGADAALGRIRQAMEAAGTWQTTHVIVLSDHWYRRQSILLARSDHRVPFIVRLAGSHSGNDYVTPVRMTVLRTVVTAVASGDVRTAAALAAHLANEGQPTEAPAVLRWYGKRPS